MGARYVPPKLVLFGGATRSACGRAVAAVGPVLLLGRSRGVSRHRVLQRLDAPLRRARRFRAGLRGRPRSRPSRAEPDRGSMGKFDAQAQRTDARGRNALSVRLELQADCYAGVWGHFAQRRNLLEPGDVDEGLRAAAAVGDDRIQRQTPGRGGARVVHPRLVRAARALVQGRPRVRRHAQLQHVRGTLTLDYSGRPARSTMRVLPGPGSAMTSVLRRVARRDPLVSPSSLALGMPALAAHGQTPAARRLLRSR